MHLISTTRSSPLEVSSTPPFRHEESRTSSLLVPPLAANPTNDTTWQAIHDQAEIPFRESGGGESSLPPLSVSYPPKRASYSVRSLLASSLARANRSATSRSFTRMSSIASVTTSRMATKLPSNAPSEAGVFSAAAS